MTTKEVHNTQYKWYKKMGSPDYALDGSEMPRMGTLVDSVSACSKDELCRFTEKTILEMVNRTNGMYHKVHCEGGSM